MAKLNLVLVHGVSAKFDPEWWRTWMQIIRRHLPTQRINVLPVSWEPLFSREPRRPGNFADIMGDLPAAWDERVIHLTVDTIIDAINATDTTIVLGHSLGSVIAHRALRKIGVNSVSKLITFGCPIWYLWRLGMFQHPISRPQGANAWYNVWGIRDPIVGPFSRRFTLRGGLNSEVINRVCLSTHDSHTYLRSRAMKGAITCR